MTTISRSVTAAAKSQILSAPCQSSVLGDALVHQKRVSASESSCREDASRLHQSTAEARLALPDLTWSPATMATTDADSVRTLHVVDGSGAFNTQGVTEFVRESGVESAGQDYTVVAIMGPQSSGKSTLLNSVVSARVGFCVLQIERRGSPQNAAGRSRTLPATSWASA